MKNIRKIKSDLNRTYDVQDVIDAGCTLEPLECRNCGDTEEVTFNQGIGDAYCESCGEWQLDILKKRKKKSGNKSHTDEFDTFKEGDSVNVNGTEYEYNPELLEDDNEDLNTLHIENTSNVSDETLISAQLYLSAMIENHVYDNVFEIDGGEYMIFDTYEEAEQTAINRLKDDIEHEPELFTPGFLEQHIDRAKLTRDLSDDKENMLYEDYNYMSDEELIEEKGDELEDIDTMGEVAFDRNNVIEELVERRMQGFDGVEYLEEMYGSNWYSEFKNIKYYIDEDSAAQEAVNIDGVAHFLSTYDGNQVDLNNGGVMFRTN